MKYTVTKAKKKFSPTEIIKIEKLLLTWSKINKTENRIVNNLYREHFLNPDLIYNLFKLLLKKNIVSNVDLVNTIYKYYENYILEGGKPNISNVNIFGFVLTEWSIRKNIESHFFDLFSNDYRELDLFIESIKLNKFDPNLGFIPIKKFKDVLWITFSEVSDNPFDFLVFKNREEVYTSLALSKHYKDSPVILFEFNISDHLSERFQRATIFDAQNSTYFRPPSSKIKNYGYTNPHKKGKLNIGSKFYTYFPRPEIVMDTREITFNKATNFTWL